MDVLSDVLRAVRLNGAVFFDVRACEPLVAETPHISEFGHLVMPGAEHVIPFHIMLRGSCWIEPTGCGGGEPIEFREGDIVFYPHGHGHVFVTHPGDRPDTKDLGKYRRNGQALPQLLNIGEPEAATLHFVCGYFACNTRPFNPLLDALPAQVMAPRPDDGHPIEVDLIHAAVEETGAQRPGRETMLARLSELLFVRVLRRIIEQMPDRSASWLAALRDPQVGKALQCLHAQPAHDWTLESLAREAGMSRAVLAERFADRVGETPMRYLARWRMQLAARLLEEPGRSIECVAEQVGYRSEAAFNRAFKTLVGMPPGAWRKRHGRREDQAAASAA